MHLTNRQARRFLLAYQSLWPPHSLRGKAGVLDYIRRVNCIQYDPLNVVGANNPELVLQSRVRDFQPQMLTDLLYEDRALLDDFDKVMSIYPVEDYVYFERRRQAYREHLDKNRAQAQAIIPHIRKEIEARGPLSSIDLDFEGNVDWSWAPTRIGRAGLESMYFRGELIVHHKVHTRKYYDFAHRHLPTHIVNREEPHPNDADYHDWYMLRRLEGFGLIWLKGSDVWLGMTGMKSPERRSALQRLMDRGTVLEVDVDGVSQPCYMRANDTALLDAVIEGGNMRPRAAILAPLDNMLWERRFIEELFGFYYIWEVYKPAVERQFGYYVLPILYGDRFVARFEPVLDKKSGVLTIKNWWWEEGVRPSKQMRTELQRCLRRFMRFLGAKELTVPASQKTEPNMAWLKDVTA